MRRMLLALVFALGTAAPAFAVSISDLIDLSRAGLSDDILIALVESERSVFHLDAAEVKELKSQGLSDRLILHLLSTRTLREEAARQEAFERRLEAAAASPPPPPLQGAEPEVVVIDRVETVAVPVYVPVYVPIGGVSDSHGREHRRAAPVYWGWGGKRRPDTWKETPASGKPPRR